MRLMLRCLLVVLLSGSACQTGAQSALSVHGSVVDPTGAGIPGATVRLETASGDLLTQSQSDAKGEFTFLNLPSGNYSLVVPAYSGFGSHTLALRLYSSLTGIKVTLAAQSVTLLSELRRLGVAVRPVPTAEQLGAEPGYRPSTALQRFIRNRDLTCCFPGCHHPAEYCDLDHTLAYGTSRLTHPGNLKVSLPKTSPAQNLLDRTATAGPTTNSPTAPSNGPAPPATDTPSHRAAACRSPTGTPPPPPPNRRRLDPRCHHQSAARACPYAPAPDANNTTTPSPPNDGATKPTSTPTHHPSNGAITPPARRSKAGRRGGRHHVDAGPPPLLSLADRHGVDCERGQKRADRAATRRRVLSACESVPGRSRLATTPPSPSISAAVPATGSRR